MTPRIVYLHGFNSAPQSVKGRLLEQAVAALAPGRFAIPALPHRPAAAIAIAEALIAADPGAVTIVGSSLGGYYATWLAERYGSRAVLVNPAVNPGRDLASMLGPQVNLYTGERYELTRGHFEALARYRIETITRPERYLLLAQSGDEVLDWREAAAYYRGAWQSVQGGGSHGFERFDGHIETILRFAGLGGTAWME